jgi:hypothetical protein
MYVGLALVLVAWLATASGVSVAPRAPQPQTSAAISATQALADDVQAQASRLRERMATAPVPRTPTRNPFAFAPASALKPAERSRVAPTMPLESAAVIPSEPPLQLVGVAERQTPTGVVRTALITADSDELFMLVAGETLGGRYKVSAVGVDAVELADVVSGATRRLVLR